jgi:invasion protein IalB
MEIRNFYVRPFIVPAQKSAIKRKMSLVRQYNNDGARTKIISRGSGLWYRCTYSSTTSVLQSPDTGPSCTPGKVALDAETGQIVRRVPKTAGRWGVGVSVCDLRQEHHWGIQRGLQNEDLLMNDKIASAAARPLRGSLITAVASASVTLVAASLAWGQQPAKPAAPKPPAPAAQAQAPAAPGAVPQPSAPAVQQFAPEQMFYSPWIKQCAKGQEANAKQVCFTARGSFTDTGLPMVSAVLVEPDGEKKILRVTVPEPVALPPGTRVIVDQGQPVNVPFFTCFQNGCMAEFEATPDLLAKMKSGQNLYVQAFALNNQVVSVPVALGDFKKINEGPPADQKTVETEQKKVQEELQKRQEALRAKIQAAQQQQQQQPPK